MRLLPIDLVNATFAKASFGGYKHEEVNALLNRAAQALEELTGENEDLRTQVLRLRTELDGMRNEERLVKEAIVSAQRAGELLRADAGREADLIREEARQQARAERGEAQKDGERLREEVERLQTLRKRTLNEYRALLEKSLRELGEFDAPAPVVSVVPVVPETPTPVPTDTVPFLEPRTQTYPTRLPADTKPLEPVIVEDENGEKWVS